MPQIHKRLPDEQVRVLFQRYYQGQPPCTDWKDLMGIGKSRFFVLLKAYRQGLAIKVGARSMNL